MAKFFAMRYKKDAGFGRADFLVGIDQASGGYPWPAYKLDDPDSKQYFSHVVMRNSRDWFESYLNGSFAEEIEIVELEINVVEPARP